MTTTDDLQTYVKATEDRVKAYWPRAWIVVTCWPDRWTMNAHSMPEGKRLAAEGETLGALIAHFEIEFKALRSSIWSEEDLRKTLGVELVRDDDVIHVPDIEKALAEQAAEKPKPTREELRAVHNANA